MKPGEQEGLSTKEKLILAGIEELNEYGLPKFSTRRVANRCGVSCAAPYKHFKDAHAFIVEILKYISRLYDARQRETLAKYAGADSRTQLLQAGLDYIRFLAENPQFRRVILQNYEDEDRDYRSLRTSLSIPIYRRVARYCKDVKMPPEVRERKTFVVRSLIYGAAIFFDNGGMEYNEKNMALVEAMLDREFDLP